MKQANTTTVANSSTNISNHRRILVIKKFPKLWRYLHYSPATPPFLDMEHVQKEKGKRFSKNQNSMWIHAMEVGMGFAP